MPGTPETIDQDRYCLAIEASNPGVNAEVGVARLSARGASPEVLAIEPLLEVGRNEDDLLPAIDRACSAAGVAPQRIHLVGVSVGPGGYTSLRVACAVGKMIAEAAGAACVAIPTALAVAHHMRVRTGEGRVGVLLAGKDDAAYLTVFPRGGWRVGMDVPHGGLVSAADFPLDQVEVVVGDRHVPAPLRELVGSKMIDPEFSARACLELATLLEPTDPVQLVPVYPREPDAVTLWRKRATR